MASVCRRSSTSSFSKREMNHAAMFAVTTPSSAIPDSISPTAIIRPSPVVGAWSPYPTVVIVVNDHHTASPSVLMFPSGASRSTDSTASDPNISRPTTAPTT